MAMKADPLEAALGFWGCCANVAELWWSRHGGHAHVEALAARRLRELVRHARSASPFYRRLYAALPEDAPLQALPAVTKAKLMESFDDWSTDRRVTRARVERFLSRRERIGESFLGYRVWKSSGTSGTPGIYVQDEHAMSVYEALIAVQAEAIALDPRAAPRLWTSGGRAALVAATDDHFASITCWAHLARSNPGTQRRAFSVVEPTARLVAALNAYRPDFIASYPSVLALLAEERVAGRLDIAPALAWSGGEHLGERTRGEIERALGCRVMNEYGASECLSIAFGCREGWMHVNSEWVIVEGIDGHGRPAAPGELSHSVLVTNLANRVQPVIRYDLGDRITTADAPCACGSPLPAIRLEGRSDAPLEMRTARGTRVRLVPLALSTVVEEAAGERRFQIVQTGDESIRVRFDAGDAAERARVWGKASRALEGYLASQSLANVAVALDRRPPRLDERSGKLHAVTVERPCRPKR